MGNSGSVESGGNRESLQAKDIYFIDLNWKSTYRDESKEVKGFEIFHRRKLGFHEVTYTREIFKDVTGLVVNSDET